MSKILSSLIDVCCCLLNIQKREAETANSAKITYVVLLNRNIGETKNIYQNKVNFS